MRERIEERMPFPWAVKEALLKETNGRCAHCGVPLDRYTNLTVDHVIPLNKGGINDPKNLTVLCDGCNRQKSDMVLPPKVWYPYLNKAKKTALAAYMESYMKETDYLAEDCLMPLDTFRVEVPVTAERKYGQNARKVIRMPAYIHGTRMEYDDAFAWLMEYKRFLEYRDAAGTLGHPSEFQAPCYLLKKGSIEIAMVNPWMIHEYGADIKNYRNEIMMDWFFSPKLPKRDYLPEMLAYLVYGVEKYIAGSIAASMEGACVVMSRTRCFLSDRFCGPVFDRISEGRNDVVSTFGKNERLPARIRELSEFKLLGERKACRELEKEMERLYPDGYMYMEDAMKMCADFNKRFAGKEGENG